MGCLGGGWAGGESSRTPRREPARRPEHLGQQEEYMRPPSALICGLGALGGAEVDPLDFALLARSQVALGVIEERLEARRQLDRAADDAGAVALKPVAVGRVATAGDDDHEVVGARGDRPRVERDALAHDLARVDLEPRRASRT